MRTRTLYAIGTSLALLTTATVTSSAQSSSRPTPRAGAAARHQVLRFVDRVDANSNTDIDLGKPGFSAGNQQVFVDSLLQDGKVVGQNVGVAEVVAVTDTTLTAQVVSTVILPKGRLTLQMAFTEILADGPPKVLTSAITGGTGIYRGARGQCEGTFVAGTDNANVTCDVVSGD